MANNHTAIEMSPRPPRRPSPRPHGGNQSNPATPRNNRRNHVDVHLNNNDAHTRSETNLSGSQPITRNRRDVTSKKDAQPLLETDTVFQLPPTSGPEIDDVNNDTPAFGNNNGIDDGLLENGDNPQPEDEEGVPNGYGPRIDVPFPYAPEFSPGAMPRIIPDVNVYQQKKNLAQGMMDLALLSANANQLRYVLESGGNHPYYYPSLIFITLSLIFQIAVGIGLIVNSRYDVKDQDEICKADRINNLTVIGIFLITIVNVFIASFGVATQASTAVVVNP